MDGVDAGDVVEDVDAVFEAGGDVAADGRETLGAVEAAELARDFGLEFDHAEIPFGLVIIKRNFEISGEREELVSVRDECSGEVVAVAFVGGPCPPGGWVRIRGQRLGAAPP